MAQDDAPIQGASGKVRLTIHVHGIDCTDEDCREQPYNELPAKVIGVSDNCPGIRVRGINHFTECFIALYPNDSTDDDCTCMDWGPY